MHHTMMTLRHDSKICSAGRLASHLAEVHLGGRGKPGGGGPEFREVIKTIVVVAGRAPMQPSFWLSWPVR